MLQAMQEDRRQRAEAERSEYDNGGAAGRRAHGRRPAVARPAVGELSVAQEILRQVSFNGGELDPRMRARRDTKIFYNMVELAQNLVTTPAGTLEGRPGLSFIDYIRHRLDRVTLSEPLIGVPAGGVAANVLVDDGLLLETTWTSAPTPRCC
jgi:hypothetical protein